MDACSYVRDLAAVHKFAEGCGIDLGTLNKARCEHRGILSRSVKQIICNWWLESDLPSAQKAGKIKKGFEAMGTPGVFRRLQHRYPAINVHEPNGQDGPSCSGIEAVGNVSNENHSDSNGLTVEAAESLVSARDKSFLKDVSTYVYCMDRLRDLALGLGVPQDIIANLDKPFDTRGYDTPVYKDCAYNMLVKWYA